MIVHSNHYKQKSSCTILFDLKIEQSKNIHDNPPNDYELILLVIIWNDTFYDKKFRIIKKCHVGRHNLLQSPFGSFL